MIQFREASRFSVKGETLDAGAFAWSPDASRVAVLATLTRSASVFAVASGGKIASLGGFAGGPTSVGFAPDGRVIVPAYRSDVALTLWDCATGEHAAAPGPSPGMGIVANLLLKFSQSADRKVLAGLHNGSNRGGAAFSVAIYDAAAWRLIADDAVDASDLALSPDGARLALVGARGRVDIMDVRSGTMIGGFHANANTVRCLAWSADGLRLATGAFARGFGLDPAAGAPGPLIDTDLLQIWDGRSGQRLAAARADVGGGVESLDFSPDGRWLATTTADRVCRVWDQKDLSLLGVVARDLHPSKALVRFSGDSRRLGLLQTGPAILSIHQPPTA